MLGFRARIATIAVSVAVALTSFTPSFAMQMPAAPVAAADKAAPADSQQVHWRDNRLATDWGSLVAQVRRWQETGRLGWSDEDIRFVARYLNDSIYKFPETSDSLTLAPPLQGLAMRDFPARLAAGSPAAAHRSRPSP